MLQNCLKFAKTAKCVRKSHSSRLLPVQAQCPPFYIRTFSSGSQKFSKEFSHTFRRPSFTSRGVRQVTTKAMLSNSGNAAHNAAVVAQNERERRIINLVEKRIKMRDNLIEQSLNGDAEALNHEEKIKTSKLIKEIEPLVKPWSDLVNARSSLANTLPLLSDPDENMREMAEEDVSMLEKEISSLINDVLPPLLFPISPTRDVSAIVELKAGAGGDEAGLFAADLLKMYTRYAEAWGHDISSRGSNSDGSPGKGWKVSIVSETPLSTQGKGGYKEVIFEVKGKGAYDSFKWENGVHRVQRVPKTETAGRVHTSAVAAVVFPLTEENGSGSVFSTFQIDEKEIKLEVMRAQGAGGQHVNKTESAVRLTHIPTGITVNMQDSRSQHANKRYAMLLLRSRVYDLKLREDAEKNRDTRRALIKGMDRSDKIRTYNYVQDRVTDHRTGFTTMNLANVLDGEGLESVIDACRKQHEEETMQALLDEEDLD